MAERPENSIACVPFSEGEFEGQIVALSGASPGKGQVGYLGRYLAGLGAQSLVVESHYVDRHYSEEYAAYYSRSLLQRSSACARVHAFAVAIDDAEFDRRLTTAARSEANAEAVREELQQAYLGYVVVRPVASVPIGRTVLKALDGDADRVIETVVPYSVHLAGFRLEVEGLAFQEQDRAVAACATTAAWTALQRVRRREGGRAPSPYQITEAAVKNVLEGRPYPSQGLTGLQITEALRHFDFPPDVIAAPQDPALFWLLLQAYLRSRIPVVLMLPPVGREPIGHAVTAVGYRRTGPRFSHPLAGNTDLVNSGFSQIYYHDDQLGPYARARVGIEHAESAWAGPGLHPVIHVERAGHAGVQRPIHSAIVPLYPKLRSNARELWTSALRFLPTLQTASPNDLEMEFFFTRSGTYLRRLFRKGLDPARVAGLQRRAAFSRYTGVIRYSVAGQAVLDFVCDTTDTVRDETRFTENLLAVVARHPAAEPLADAIGNNTGALVG